MILPLSLRTLSNEIVTDAGYDNVKKKNSTSGRRPDFRNVSVWLLRVSINHSITTCFRNAMICTLSYKAQWRTLNKTVMTFLRGEERGGKGRGEREGSLPSPSPPPPSPATFLAKNLIKLERRIFLRILACLPGWVVGGVGRESLSNLHSFGIQLTCLVV